MTKPLDIAILSDGGWATALALLLHAKGHRTTVWGAFPEQTRCINTTHENTAFLPGVPLPPTLRFTASEEEAVRGAHLVVLATPSRFFHSVCQRFAPLVPPATPLVSVAKGFCETTLGRMSEIAGSTFRDARVAVLSGPSHAEEVARGLPTVVTAAARDPDLAGFVQDTFSTPRFRVYTSDDVTGVELGGALKNVIAVAVGASDGMGLGDNARAAIITRGLAEITRLGVALGARPETFSGLSGVGDLIVTCTSAHSRNHTVGERLGRGEKIDAILASMQMVAEGVWNAKAVRRLALRENIEMPISEQVYALCHENADPREALEALMSRDAKPE